MCQSPAGDIDRIGDFECDVAGFRCNVALDIEVDDGSHRQSLIRCLETHQVDGSVVRVQNIG